MAKKVTISVPEELHEKMTTYRDRFNFSEVFRKAISKEIQSIESFLKGKKEEINMTAVIERLQKEKNEVETNWFDEGKKDGFDWCADAHYSEILEARILEVEGNGWPKCNSVVEHLEHLRDESPPWEKYGELFGDNRWELSPLGLKYIKGFKSGVSEFWNEVKDKLRSSQPKNQSQSLISRPSS
jgi:hypothetical protein